MIKFATEDELRQQNISYIPPPPPPPPPSHDFHSRSIVHILIYIYKLSLDFSETYNNSNNNSILKNTYY